MCKTKDYKHIYCLFCRTGAEESICEEIHRKFTDVFLLSAIQEKHSIVNKLHEIARRVFLPGYLWLYSDELLDLTSFTQIENLYRILGDDSCGYELLGSDRAFADWLLKNDGIIGISLIENKDDRISVISGPMKYFVKDIIKLDKHTKNALVKMDFLGTTREIWLAFEFYDRKI